MSNDSNEPKQKPRGVLARYGGRCSKCGHLFDVDYDRIVRNPGGRGWCHVKCAARRNRTRRAARKPRPARVMPSTRPIRQNYVESPRAPDESRPKLGPAQHGQDSMFMGIRAEPGESVTLVLDPLVPVTRQTLESAYESVSKAGQVIVQGGTRTNRRVYVQYLTGRGVGISESPKRQRSATKNQGHTIPRRGA